MVWVEINALAPGLQRKPRRRQQIASDFPTPVPASATSACRPIKASATATASSCCCGRYSKSRDFASTPLVEKACRTASLNPGTGWPSLREIISRPSHPAMLHLPSRKFAAFAKESV